MSLSNQLTPPPITADFVAVDLIIRRQLASKVPLIEQIAHHIIDSGGKRLRPLLVLLVARAFNYTGDKHILLAALVEFLHTSTLLHDDVIDESQMRRKKPTANAQWGNAPAVLVGDFLYARSFQMMIEIGSLPIMAVLSDATSKIAEGEVKQLCNIGNAEIDETTYFATIDGKTAQLFQAAAHCSILLCDANPEEIDRIRLFGNYLGLAFQLVDDYLDYCGNAATLGKNIGDDLAEGKPTLPLIRAMQVANNHDTAIIRKAIEHGDLNNLTTVLGIIKSTDALAYTRAEAEKMSQLALMQLDKLAPSPYLDSLIFLTQYAVNRQN